MESIISIGIELFFLISSIIVFVIFIINGFNFYLCLIPLATGLTAIITLIVSIKDKKRKPNRIN